MMIIGKIKKNAFLNTGSGVAIFSTFLQNELLLLCMSS